MGDKMNFYYSILQNKGENPNKLTLRKGTMV